MFIIMRGLRRRRIVEKFDYSNQIPMIPKRKKKKETKNKLKEKKMETVD